MVILQILLTVLALLLGLAGVALNIAGLPGNWVMVIAALVLSWMRGWHEPSPGALVAVAGILLVAEAVDFLSGYLGAKKFGASKGAAWAALAGGMIGALGGVFIPIPIAGSVAGAIAGAFGGAFICEALKGRTVEQSLAAAGGAAIGRTAGLLAKITCGLAAWSILLFTAW